MVIFTIVDYWRYNSRNPTRTMVKDKIQQYGVKNNSKNRL